MGKVSFMSKGNVSSRKRPSSIYLSSTTNTTKVEMDQKLISRGRLEGNNLREES